MAKHRSHRHHRSKENKLVPYHLLLFFLSLVTLVSIIVLMQQVDSAPIWKIGILGMSSFTGLMFCVLLLKRSKK
jgi:hypothetical protein